MSDTTVGFKIRYKCDTKKFKLIDLTLEDITLLSTILEYASSSVSESAVGYKWQAIKNSINNIVRNPDLLK